MLSNTVLRNFDNYLRTTPASQLGMVLPQGAYDAAGGAVAHGFARRLRLKDLARGGALDSAGPDPDDLAKIREMMKTSGVSMDDVVKACSASDDGDPDDDGGEHVIETIKKFCASKGLSDRDAMELQNMLMPPAAEASDQPTTPGAPKTGGGVVGDSMRYFGQRRDYRQGASQADRAAFDKANGITSRRIRNLGP